MLKKVLATLTLIGNPLIFASELFEDPNDPLPPITIKKITSLPSSAPKALKGQLMIVVSRVKECPLPNNRWIFPKVSDHIESSNPSLKVYRHDDLLLCSRKTSQGNTFEYRAVLCRDFLKYAHYQKGIRITDEKNHYQGKLSAHQLVGTYKSHEIQIKIPELLNVQELALELYQLGAYYLTIFLDATINVDSNPILSFANQEYEDYLLNMKKINLGILRIRPTAQGYKNVKHALINYFKWVSKNEIVTQLLFEGNKIEESPNENRSFCLQGNEDTNKRFSTLIKDLQIHIFSHTNYVLRIYPYQNDRDFKAMISLLQMEEENSQEQAEAERTKLSRLIRDFAIKESNSNKSSPIYISNIELTTIPDDILAIGKDLESVKFLKNPKKKFKSPDNT